MATLEVTGTMKLATRILDDARADAERTKADARQSIAAIRADSEHKLAACGAELAARRESAVKGVLDGCKTRASLDGRKAALAEKRLVIDEVFDRAYRALLALNDDARAKVCLAMLLSEAEDGDIVLPAQRDRAILAGLMDKLGGKRLTLADTDAAIQGGFVLSSEGYEKDCSFASLLGDLRLNEETEIARRLFADEGGQS